MTQHMEDSIYHFFYETGKRGFCWTCREWQPLCIDHREDGSTECYGCCIKRLRVQEQVRLAGLDLPEPKPKPEPLKNFDYEDFCRL